MKIHKMFILQIRKLLTKFGTMTLVYWDAVRESPLDAGPSGPVVRDPPAVQLPSAIEDSNIFE